MADRISSIASSPILKVDRLGFYRMLQPGDAVFCQGNYAVSKAIERATGSCLSHILMAWLPGDFAEQWLTAESTADKGVHVGLLTDYVDRYDGDLVIARLQGVTPSTVRVMLNNFFGVLECAYNAVEEVETVAHRLARWFPVAQPRRELYCSQLWKYMRAGTLMPCGAGADGVNYTPEDAWRDAKMLPIAALCK
jgi:hypothetical protein